MFKYSLISIFVIYSILINAQESINTNKYVGVSVCATCHKSEKTGNQEGVWKNSSHSKAFETLKTEKAKEFAVARGIDVNPYEAAECLNCHTTGTGLSAEMKDAKFSSENGVQCETCHGAGSNYKTMKIMKNREESVKSGMTDIKVSDGSAEKLCLTCHNDESPTFQGFNFEEYWNKIKHPVITTDK